MGIMESIGNFFSGNRDYDSDNPGRGGGPKTSLRPRLRPGSYNPTGPSRSESSGDSDGDIARREAAARFAARTPVTFEQAGLSVPTASELLFETPEARSKFFSDVPYHSGPSIRPPDPNRKSGLQDFRDSYKSLYPSMATDLKLGLGSLRSPEAFGDALSKMYGEELPQDVIDQALKNFTDASDATDKANSSGNSSDGDDNNFYGNYDPCPEGYRTDPVTGMCVPVMGMSYETAPAAPAQYQGNFVDSPFPDLAPRGPALPMGGLPMSGYTQAMNYTPPTIAPSSMAAQGMGIAGIPMTPILG